MYKSHHGGGGVPATPLQNPYPAHTAEHRLWAAGQGAQQRGTLSGAAVAAAIRQARQGRTPTRSPKKKDRPNSPSHRKFPPTRKVTYTGDVKRAERSPSPKKRKSAMSVNAHERRSSPSHQHLSPNTRGLNCQRTAHLRLGGLPYPVFPPRRMGGVP